MPPRNRLDGGAIERRDAVRDLIERARQAANVTHTEIARCTERTLQRWQKLCREGERQAMPLADLCALPVKMRDEILSELARAAGYRLTPSGEAKPTPGDLVKVQMRSMRETCDVQAVYAEVIADGKVTPSEVEKHRREKDEAVASLEVQHATLAQAALACTKPAKGQS